MLDLSQNAVTDQLQIGQASHPGRSGKNNEDYYGVFSVATAGGECVVAAVADGIGGSVGGEQASRLAINAMHASLNDPLYVATSPGQRLDQAIRIANRQIYERSQNEPALAGMGTTIVAVALDGERLYVAHAGDSRAYLIRGGRAHQLTLDHSWAQEAIEAGRIKPEEARTHPNRHVIRRYLGINEEVETDPRVVDPAQAGSGRAATIVSPILTQGGDAIVLCSDGLTDEVSDEDIARIVSKHAPADAARRLVDAANAAGGADNITAVILQRGAGKPLVAAGRSRLAAYGLALMAALLVGALGWLIASGALFGKPDGGAAAADATDAGASVAAAALATSTPVTADAPALPTAEVTAEVTAEAMAETTAGVQPSAAAPTSTPAAPTSTPLAGTPVATEPAAAEATASTQLTPTSSPVPAHDPAKPDDRAKNGSGAAATEPTPGTAADAAAAATPAVTPEMSAEAPADPAIAASPTAVEAALAATVSPTAAPAVTPTVQPPGPTAPPTAAPTSTPAMRGTATPTVTATPTARPTLVPAPTSTPRAAPPIPIAPPPSGNGYAAQVPPQPLAPSPAPMTEGGPTSVRIISPTGTKYSSTELVSFAWESNKPLLEGQCFELVFWQPGQQWRDGRSVIGASDKTSVAFTPSSADKSGEFRWAVLLVTCNPYEMIRPLSSENSITFDGTGNTSASEGGGDNGGGDNDGGNAGGK